MLGYTSTANKNKPHDFLLCYKYQIHILKTSNLLKKLQHLYHVNLNVQQRASILKNIFQ